MDEHTIELGETSAIRLIAVCPACGENVKAPAHINITTEYVQDASGSWLRLAPTEIPDFAHRCQDPQPPFIDRGGLAEGAPLSSPSDGPPTRSSSGRLIPHEFSPDDSGRCEYCGRAENRGLGLVAHATTTRSSLQGPVFYSRGSKVRMDPHEFVGNGSGRCIRRFSSADAIATCGWGPADAVHTTSPDRVANLIYLGELGQRHHYFEGNPNSWCTFVVNAGTYANGKGMRRFVCHRAFADPAHIARGEHLPFAGDDLGAGHPEPLTDISVAYAEQLRGLGADPKPWEGTRLRPVPAADTAALDDAIATLVERAVLERERQLREMLIGVITTTTGIDRDGAERLTDVLAKLLAPS